MGSQRRMAEALMEHFLITEDEAYKLTELIEKAEIGDEISDALYLIYHENEVRNGLTRLSDLQTELGLTIVELRLAFLSLQKRRTS